MERTFRYAREEDLPLIMDLIKELADYEKLGDEVVIQPEVLSHWLFEKATAEVLFVMEDGIELGYALFFHNFSTFLGRGGIYLEDLFVRPEHRGKGHGKAFIKELARIALQRGCGRLEWSCLDWNQPSIDFYLSLGAKPMTGWTQYRVDGEALLELGKP